MDTNLSPFYLSLIASLSCFKIIVVPPRYPHTLRAPATISPTAYRDTLSQDGEKRTTASAFVSLFLLFFFLLPPSIFGFVLGHRHYIMCNAVSAFTVLPYFLA